MSSNVIHSDKPVNPIRYSELSPTIHKIDSSSILLFSLDSSDIANNRPVSAIVVIDDADADGGESVVRRD